MKKKTFLNFIIFLSVSFYSCNDPLARKYSAISFEQDVIDLRQSNKITDGDIKLLVKYMMILKFSGKDFHGQTYGDILNKIKSFNQSNQSQIQRQTSELDTRRKILNKFLTVGLLEKGFVRIKNKNFLSYTLIFQNQSSDYITTVIGSLKLNDLLEKQIKKVDILLEEQIRPKGPIKKIYFVEYNNADEDDQRIRSQELIDLRIEWNPERIILKNGKILE